MPRVFIPPLLRPLTGDVEEVTVDAKNVRQVIAALESRFPGIESRLCDEDGLQPGLTVAVDGNISSLGLLQQVGEESEVHFLPAIGGG
ncbi:MAG: molybdopterin synthase sulfur carrier subunit [Planctomycetaceae bacterium]|jgi:sulfur-carrier protein|nr:molybdopterin synthase sulfur carrier subunit [Planctomycetaceae bacterium]MBT6157009.1 molybdopterin synthase sulfur carrier subunit [Planctomycetaceae bacterium]MBT6484425.1 molybdopterin synthase sulfur carrier subunit [Planctomycetaceae bacterium]MBT6494666.1 molybdopterin synthase sulfur carrier subunit [Planctomycetaceae bacterium]